MNLFEKYDTIFTPARLEAFSKLVGPTSGDLEKSLKGVYFTLVAGLIRRSQSSMGSSLLLNQVTQSNMPGGLVDSLEEVLGDRKKAEALQEKGLKVISHVFPAFKSPLISTLGSYTGVNKQTATWVISVVTQVLLDTLAQIVQEEKFTEDDLVFFLQKHQEPLLNSAPDGLLEKMVPALGLQDLQNTKLQPTQRKSNSVQKKEEDTEEESSEQGSLFSGKILILGILLVGLIAGGIYWYQQKPQAVETPVAAVEEEEIITPDQIDSLLKVQPVKVEDTTQVPTHLRELWTYVADSTQPAGKRFDTPELSFSIGKTVVDTSAQAAVNSLIQLMSDYPKTEIKIEGYGTRPDPKLGQKRALSLKNTLLAAGIDNRRVDAGGVPNGKNMAIVVIKK